MENEEVNEANIKAVEDLIKKLYDVKEVNKEQCQRFLNVIGDLNERELTVMRKRYGLIDGKPVELEEIAKYFGMTKEIISQAECSAIVKLKHPVRMRKVLEGYKI